jgi:hypothetical protein
MEGIATAVVGWNGGRLRLLSLPRGEIKRSPPVDRLIHSYFSSVRQAELGIILTATDSSSMTWLRSTGVEAIVLDAGGLVGRR